MYLCLQNQSVWVRHGQLQLWLMIDNFRMNHVPTGSIPHVEIHWKLRRASIIPARTVLSWNHHSLNKTKCTCLGQPVHNPKLKNGPPDAANQNTLPSFFIVFNHMLIDSLSITPLYIRPSPGEALILTGPDPVIRCLPNYNQQTSSQIVVSLLDLGNYFDSFTYPPNSKSSVTAHRHAFIQCIKVVVVIWFTPPQVSSIGPRSLMNTICTCCTKTKKESKITQNAACVCWMPKVIHTWIFCINMKIVISRDDCCLDMSIIYQRAFSAGVIQCKCKTGRVQTLKQTPATDTTICEARIFRQWNCLVFSAQTETTDTQLRPAEFQSLVSPDQTVFCCITVESCGQFAPDWMMKFSEKFHVTSFNPGEWANDAHCDEMNQNGFHLHLAVMNVPASTKYTIGSTTNSRCKFDHQTETKICTTSQGQFHWQQAEVQNVSSKAFTKWKHTKSYSLLAQKKGNFKVRLWPRLPDVNQCILQNRILESSNREKPKIFCSLQHKLSLFNPLGKICQIGVCYRVSFWWCHLKCATLSLEMN